MQSRHRRNQIHGPVRWAPQDTMLARRCESGPSGNRVRALLRLMARWKAN